MFVHFLDTEERPVLQVLFKIPCLFTTRTNLSQNVVTFENGDVYTGQLDADGRRHGQGRCDYANSGGSYTGQWEADKPHGCGERLYPPAGGQGKEEREEEEDFSIDAFGPGCPLRPTSYKGDWKDGVREGNGICVFAVEASTATTTISGSFDRTRDGNNTSVPDSYEGEWVRGCPFGRGVLRMRPATPNGSSVSTTSAAACNDRVGRGCGGSISGKWTEEGLVYGRETLPGKGGVYKGQYRRGKREGRGRLELTDGSKFEGVMRTNKMCYHFLSCSFFTGCWHRNRDGGCIILPPLARPMYIYIRQIFE